MSCLFGSILRCLVYGFCLCNFDGCVLEVVWLKVYGFVFVFLCCQSLKVFIFGCFEVDYWIVLCSCQFGNRSLISWAKRLNEWPLNLDFGRCQGLWAI